MNPYHTPHNLMELQQNTQEIQQRIDTTCKRTGRNPAEIRLLPVTKTLPFESIEQAYQLGFHCSGENKVLEAKGKYEALQHLPIQLILIGHLQSNKVKYVANSLMNFIP